MRKVTDDQRAKATKAARSMIESWGLDWDSFWANRMHGEAFNRRRMVVSAMLAEGLYCSDVSRITGLNQQNVCVLANERRYQAERARGRERRKRATQDGIKQIPPFQIPAHLRHTDDARYALYVARSLGYDWGELWKHKGKGGPLEAQTEVIHRLRNAGMPSTRIAALAGRIPSSIRMLISDHQRRRNAYRCMKRRYDVPPGLVETCAIMSIPEIAKHMGITTAQVKWEIKKATHKLRTLLESDPYIQEWLREHQRDYQCSE